MTKTFFKISFAAAVTIFAVSCKKNNYVVDKDVVAPTFAKFNVRQSADTLATYFVTETNETYKIPVGITAPSSSDVTINFTYSSPDAVAGQQYNAPASITIPAGETIGTLEIAGLFPGFTSTSQVDTLDIKIAGGDVPTSSYWKGYRLIMRKYCNVDIASFDGDYDGTLEYTASGAVGYGPYSTAVSNITSTGATTAEADIANLYDYGGEVHALFEWTNKVHKVTIPEQNTGALVASGGVTYALWMRTNGAASTFSSCEGTITVVIDALAKNPTTGALAGSFSTAYKITMFR
jgi:hypothetical protein